MTDGRANEDPMSTETTCPIEEKFSGPHDCGPKSLLRVLPDLDPEEVRKAFILASDNWPYGGVNNREFFLIVNYLSKNSDISFESEYSHEEESLANLLSRKPSKCVALLKGHFIAILDGEVVGREPLLKPYEETDVVCSWTFS